jgi:serine/threonine protein kinase
MRWPDQPYNLLRRQFPELSDAGLSLLNGLLTYDPNQRLTAHQALNSQYFQVGPHFKDRWQTGAFGL